MKKWKEYFRPLSGNYISQFDSDAYAQLFALAISVPCRGTTFLNKARKIGENDIS